MIVEVNCETDFVAKTPDFQALVKQIGEHIFEHAPADVAALLGQPFAGGKSVGEAVQEKIAVIKENIVIRRFARYALASGHAGVVGTYIHPPAPRSACWSSSTTPCRERATSKALAQGHRDARRGRPPPPRPCTSTKDEVPAECLEKEKEIYKAQAAAAGQARERRRRRSPRASSRSTTRPSACWSSPSSRTPS